MRYRERIITGSLGAVGIARQFNISGQKFVNYVLAQKYHNMTSWHVYHHPQMDNTYVASANKDGNNHFSKKKKKNVDSRSLKEDVTSETKKNQRKNRKEQLHQIMILHQFY